jgi:hypothetical protein
MSFFQGIVNDMGEEACFDFKRGHVVKNLVDKALTDIRNAVDVRPGKLLPFR